MPAAKIDEEELRAKLINKLVNCELLLSHHKVDNFHIARRRRNSHFKHLNTEYFSCAYTEDLVDYYGHLAGKLKRAGLLGKEEDHV